MKRMKFLTIASLLVLSMSLFNSNAQAQDRKVNIKSFHDTFVTADLDKGGQLFSARKDAKVWEVFTVVPIAEGKVALKGSNGKFVTLDKTGKLFARAIVAQANETFDVVVVNENWIALKASNGKYVTADKDKKFELVANRANIAEWESFNFITIQ